MNELVIDQGWIATGGSLFLLLLVTAVYYLTRDSLTEEDIVLQQDDDEPFNPMALLPVERRTFGGKDDPLYRLGDWFVRLRYHERGITFEDYVRKVNNGTWHELARA